MSAVPVLDAVPMQDTIYMTDIQTFKDDQGRNYSYMFNFEQEFEHSVVRVWMENNWRGVCAWASGIYLLLIFGGQLIMANRQPFQLRGPLTVWNIMLALFSITGAARTFPEFIYTFSTQGFHHSLCVPSFIERDRVSGFWTWMFVLSKVPELGDTIFIVLRKQRLIFLHWYHHVTVLIYCWYSFSEYTAPARWFVVMNFAVHSLMYTYYAFRALRFRIPQYVAMVITTLQLVQMVVGCLVNYIAYTLKRRGVECGVSDTNLQLSLLMYTSYFVLFARFFYNTYFKRRQGVKMGEEKIIHLKKGECEKIFEGISTNIKESGHTQNKDDHESELEVEKLSVPTDKIAKNIAEAVKSFEDKHTNEESEVVKDDLDIGKNKRSGNRNTEISEEQINTEKSNENDPATQNLKDKQIEINQMNVEIEKMEEKKNNDTEKINDMKSKEDGDPLILSG